MAGAFCVGGVFYVSGDRGVPADIQENTRRYYWADQEGGAVYLFGYGEKVKAYLRRGARLLPGFTEYPNPQVGYGALCVMESIPG